MNYFAHLCLAQPTPASKVGNLLGDFMRGVAVNELPLAVRLGLENHRLVDRFTDQHPLVVDSRQLFSPARRRFAGVALDVLFDHFLVRHWSRFHSVSLPVTIAEDYALLQRGQPLMPAAMQATTERMIAADWVQRYGDARVLAVVLERIAGRLRFANDFAASIDDIERHYAQLEQVFLQFYPELVSMVAAAGLEQ